jgi:hypothetical protein
MSNEGKIPSRNRESRGSFVALVFSLLAYFGAVYINGNFATYKNPILFRTFYGLLVMVSLISFAYTVYYALTRRAHWQRKALLLGATCVCAHSLIMTTLAFVSVGFFG